MPRIDHTRAAKPTAISAADFPVPSSITKPGPTVLSIYLGKTAKPSRPQPGVLQAWRLARRQYVLLEQIRGRLESGELRSLLDEFIEAFGPVAVLVGGGRGNPALVARIASRYPNLVRRVQTDSGAKNVQVSALAAVIVNERIAIPADAPWRDRCVRRFCAISESKLNAQVRAAMQFVAHADEFAAPPAAIEKPAIAAGMIGFRAVTVDRQPGERPGLCSTGREAIMRRLAGPVFQIKTEVIW